MFGALEKYRSKQFYEEHKIIGLVTKEGARKYEIIAVFKTDAYTGFKYYDFVKSQNKGEFDTFIKKCKELSFYNTKNTAEYGDRLITLSTCEYSSENGRLVVIAKELS